MVRDFVTASEAVRAGKGKAPVAPRRLRTLRIGDTRYVACCVLALSRAGDESVRAGLIGVEHVEFGDGAAQLIPFSEPGVRILRHRSGHRDGARNEFVHRGRVQIR